MSHHSASVNQSSFSALPGDDVYPRPQLRRPHWQSLDGAWRFLFDNERRFTHPREIEATAVHRSLPTGIQGQWNRRPGFPHGLLV
jgi:hypothetical protein